MVTLTRPLRSLELVDGLIELTVDRRLISHNFVDRVGRERSVYYELLRFILRSEAEPPVFLGDLFNQDLLQRAHRFQILVQAGEQTGELLFVLAVNRESLRK